MKSNKLVRKFIPSIAKLTYNPLFKIINSIANLSHLIFPEFKSLPPAHLRARIGVGNRLIYNQIYHLKLGEKFWINQLLDGFCSSTSNIVELGCGCGRMIRPLFENPAYQGHFYGIDIDEEMLRWCRKNMARENFSFILSNHKSKTYQKNNSTLPNESLEFWPIPIESETIDFVYSSSLFTHLLEPELKNYLIETSRILKKGGATKMTFFSMENVKIGDRWTFRHKIGKSFVENKSFPEAAVAYSNETLIEMAKLAGFSRSEIIPSEGQSIFVAWK